jgi:DtxR family Mn-dependent transcriptional regulator
MDYQNISDSSENEQMYLVMTALLEEETPGERVSLTNLANALSIQPVSANQMVRKLSEGGYLDYQPYKGVSLTNDGQRIVRRILRFRRLWETFLVKQLGFSLEQADQLACRMEHITTEGLAARLGKFLDDPTVSPSGKPIPAQAAIEPVAVVICLSELSFDHPAVIAEAGASDQGKSFLTAQGLVPGAQVRVLGRGSHGDVLVGVNDQEVHLTEGLLAGILVYLPEESGHVEGS